MATFRKSAARSFSHLKDYFKKVSRTISRKTGIGDDPVTIDTYWGYGRADYLFLKGRVLQDEQIEVTENDGLWQNLVNSYKRFESDEIPNAKVTVTYLGHTFKAVTDEEGFFTIDQQFKPKKDKPDFPLTKATIRVYSIPYYPDVEVTDEAFVMVPKDTAEYGVISDIDDTVLQSYVTSPLMSKTAYYTFFKSAKSRMSFVGAPELYRAFRKGSTGNRRNPVFYVSNSPYNLFDFLLAFLETAKLPLGPVMLRDFGLFKKRDPKLKSEKYESIAHILRTFPDLPFILIGDSGEHDADIYQDIAHTFPQRIQAIYIRDVQSKKRAKRIKVLIESFKDVPMILARDSSAIEKHAIKKGFIRERTLERAKEQLQEV